MDSGPKGCEHLTLSSEAQAEVLSNVYEYLFKITDVSVTKSTTDENIPKRSECNFSSKEGFFYQRTKLPTVAMEKKEFMKLMPACWNVKDVRIPTKSLANLQQLI